MILGLKKLFRWAALLLTTSRAGGTPPAVGQTAVVRGRLMELLTAELLSPEECDNAFVVGVFSLLDVMLGQPMEKALESIALDSHNNFIDARGKVVALVGVRDLIVVDTPDALLVASRDRAQEVGDIVKALEKRNRHDLL